MIDEISLILTAISQADAGQIKQRECPSHLLLLSPHASTIIASPELVVSDDSKQYWRRRTVDTHTRSRSSFSIRRKLVLLLVKQKAAGSSGNFIMRVCLCV